MFSRSSSLLRSRFLPRASGRSRAGAAAVGLAAQSATDAWAVGSAYASDGATGQPLTEHWNGRGWTRVPAPGVAGSQQSSLLGVAVALTGVTVAADGQAWAVGIPLENSRRPLVLHWTGHAWAAATTPESNGDVMLDGVTAASPDDVWAVGTVSVDGGAYLSQQAFVPVVEVNR